MKLVVKYNLLTYAEIEKKSQLQKKICLKKFVLKKFVLKNLS